MEFNLLNLLSFDIQIEALQPSPKPSAVKINCLTLLSTGHAASPYQAWASW